MSKRCSIFEINPAHKPIQDNSPIIVAHKTSACASEIRHDESFCFAVVSIRGTLSLEDCLTDFMCEPADINEWMTAAPSSELGRASSFTDDTPEVQLASRGDTITAHAGILEAAKAVVKDLQVIQQYIPLLHS